MLIQIDDAGTFAEPLQFLLRVRQDARDVGEARFEALPILARPRGPELHHAPHGELRQRAGDVSRSLCVRVFGEDFDDARPAIRRDRHVLPERGTRLDDGAALVHGRESERVDDLVGRGPRLHDGRQHREGCGGSFQRVARVGGIFDGDDGKLGTR